MITIGKTNKKAPRKVKANNAARKSASRSPQRRKAADNLDEYFGCFRDSALWSKDSVTLIREQRDAW